MERAIIDNRLDFNEFMYCEGCPNPYYRGTFHGIITCIIPIGWYLILLNCENEFQYIIYSLYMACNLISYFSSYFFHRESHKYGPEIENLAIKIDRFSIFLNIAGNFTPVSVFFLKKGGAYFISLLWGGVIFQYNKIFYYNKSAWWEPLAFGAIALLFTEEFYETMTTYEFWMLISSYAASVIGGICFALRIPDTIPEIWGYFEWYHLSVGIASIIVYCINYSLSSHNMICR
jgi:channel protein (hemolysin III family)